MDKGNAQTFPLQRVRELAGLEAEQEVQPRYLTYRQAEVYTGLSRTTLWRLVSSGEITASRIGRAVRFDRRSLEDYMERVAHAC